MPPPLPPEILDLIVDFLHDEPGALKACCLASKSWVHRTRTHLFAQVEFSSESHLKLWEKTFPDPSNSPARYTRDLTIYTSQALTSGGWIRAFSGLVWLQVDIRSYGSNEEISFSLDGIDEVIPSLDGSGEQISFVPLRGLSPTIKSLYLSYGSYIPFSEIFDLVYSFPLLEDLSLVCLGSSEDDRWDIPLTSPRFTGCLDLDIDHGVCPAVRRLLELPSGLHFSKISMTYGDKDVELMMDLMLKCSDTLEYLGIYYLTATPAMCRLDLSKLKRLKEVFLRAGPNVLWVIGVLQTAESTNLRQITIRFPFELGAWAEERFHQDWQDLDRALLQFWTSHSIRPRIEYWRVEEGCELRELASRLLPELTGRGIVDLFKYD